MRVRIFVGTLLFVSILASATLGTSGDRVAPARQWAVVHLSEPTLIGETIVQGPVLFVHDDARMARGEPCTTVLLFEPTKGPTEEIASFHCIPTPRRVVGQFTMRTRPNVSLGFGCVLTEYQFAGESEAHGVPARVNAH